MTSLDKLNYICFEKKNESFDMFHIYKVQVENQLNWKIKRVKSDRSNEYILFNDFCRKKIHEVTPLYSFESNGVAGRKKKTLKQMINTLLVNSSAFDNLWWEPLLSVCHIQNRIFYKKTSKIL